jgi:hypothetical protein
LGLFATPLLLDFSQLFQLIRVCFGRMQHIKAIITAEEVLIRDSSDENVIPVLEEFQRRLPVGNEAHGVHGDGDLGEEDGTPQGLNFCYFKDINWKNL